MCQILDGHYATPGKAEERRIVMREEGDVGSYPSLATEPLPGTLRTEGVEGAPVLLDSHRHPRATLCYVCTEGVGVAQEHDLMKALVVKKRCRHLAQVAPDSGAVQRACVHPDARQCAMRHAFHCAPLR